jgi:hypothetical protein
MAKKVPIKNMNKSFFIFLIMIINSSFRLAVFGKATFIPKLCKKELKWPEVLCPKDLNLSLFVWMGLILLSIMTGSSVSPKKNGGLTNSRNLA